MYETLIHSERLRRWLRPPIFEDDIERTRQAASLQPILIMSAAAAILYLIVSAFQGSVFLGTVGYVVPLVFGLALLQIVSRAGRPHLASWILVGALSLMLGFSAATTDGARSPAYVVYVDVVLIAGALLGTRVAVGVGIVVAALGGAFLAADSAGIVAYPRHLHPPAVYYVSIQLVILVALALLRLSGRDIRAALERASEEIDRRLEIQDRLRFRVGLSDILASLSAAFVSAGADSADELVAYGLQELKTYLGVDACLLEYANGSGGGSGGRLWSSQGAAPTVGAALRPILDADPAFRTEMALNMTIIIQRADTAPATAQLWEALDSRMGGLSIAFILPVTSVAAEEGLLILGFLEREAELDDDVVGQCRTLAEIMVNGLNRIHVEEALRHSLVDLEHAENARRDIDHRYQQLFRDSADAIYISERDGRIVDFNPAAYALFSIPEWEGDSIDAAELYADTADRLKLQATMEADGFIQNYPVRLKTRDGDLLDCLITASVRRDPDGQVLGYQGIIRDVTQERRRQELIDLQVERLEALNRIGQAISGSTDPRLTYEVLLSEVLRLLKIDAADVLEARQESGKLVFGAGKGFRTQALRYSRLSLGQGFAGEAALKQSEVFVPDLRQKTSFERSPEFGDEGFVSYCGLPLMAKGRVCGVLELFTRASLRPSQAWWDTARAFAAQAAVAMDSAGLFADLQRTNIELVRAYDATLEGWARAHDLRDHETVGHSKRVAEMTVRLAEALNVAQVDLVHIYRGALLHDIGKLAIPDSILLKPGKLSEDEWVVMRRHPDHAYELLKGVGYLVPALDIPRFHHEHWDGKGYPDGLRGESIPLAARIFAVVDVWDALRSDRPYRKAWARGEVIDYIGERSGTQFDPRVVGKFLEIATEFDAPYV
jgi:PAS domain S-box-containing protein